MHLKTLCKLLFHSFVRYVRPALAINEEVGVEVLCNSCDGGTRDRH